MCAIPDATASLTWLTELHKALAKCALQEAWASFGVDVAKLRLDLKPTKKLIATASFAEGKLILVPLSPTVVFLEEKARTPPSAIPFASCSFTLGEKRLMAFILPKSVAATGAGKASDVASVPKEEFHVPYFHVRITPDSAANNLTSEMRSVKINKRIFEIPVLVNTTTIEKGTELAYYKPGGSASSSSSGGAQLAPDEKLANQGKRSRDHGSHEAKKAPKK